MDREPYLSGLGLLALVLVYAPVAIAAAWLLWKKLPQRPGIRLSVMSIVTLIAIALPTWDIAISTYYMRRVCEDAGVHVHRSVTTEGFLLYNRHSPPAYTRSGYRQIEAQNDRELIRWTRENGTVRTERFDLRKALVAPMSRYEVVDSPRLAVAYNVYKDEQLVRDRSTGEILARRTVYRTYPGWVDRLALSYWGPVSWYCAGGPSGRDVDLVMQTLKPAKSPAGG